MSKFAVLLVNLFILVFIWAIIAAVGLLTAHLSGHINRSYNVISKDKILQIGSINQKAADWATWYCPIMMLNNGNFTPPLLGVEYEVVETPKDVYFVYHFIWEDEVHPIKLYHYIYRIFRSAFYGTPTWDIEYFEIGVDRITGEIRELKFETSPGKDYYVAYSEHLVQTIMREEDGSFSSTLTKKNGRLVSTQKDFPVFFKSQRVVVGIATWNHLTVLVHSEDPMFTTEVTAPLTYLTDESYKKLKYVRKSQGSFRTEEPFMSVIAGLIGLIAFAVPLAVLMRFSYWMKRHKAKS